MRHVLVLALAVLIVSPSGMGEIPQGFEVVEVTSAIAMPEDDRGLAVNLVKILIALQPELCGCAVHWLRMLFERQVDFRVGRRAI